MMWLSFRNNLFLFKYPVAGLNFKQLFEMINLGQEKISRNLDEIRREFSALVLSDSF